MELLSLTLQNFKAHRDRRFDFRPGTNAICGENGAGKTSLLEAIAWVLFNYQGAYLKKDLIRNGASSAQVALRFISNRDGRTYEVSRCTTAGYGIYDPQLGAKLDYSHIEQEILPWLRQHLGVAPGTDLARLFATTLGIPQGMFTNDFLLTPEKRKPIFDRILKVEDYQTVYRESLSLQRFAEAQVDQIKTAITQYQETLSLWDDVVAKQQDLKLQIQQVQLEAETAQQTLTGLERELAALQQQGEVLQALQQQVDAKATQIQAQSQLLPQLQQHLEAAQQSAMLCQTHVGAYQQYLDAEAALIGLEAQRHTQMAGQAQREALVNALSDRQMQFHNYQQQIVQFEQLEQSLAALAPHVLQQQALETQLQDLQIQLQACQTQRSLLTREQQHQQDLQHQAQILQNEITALQALEPWIQGIPDLELSLARVQQLLSRVEAATQFQSELQHIVDQVSVESQDYAGQVANVTQRLQELQAAVPLWADPLETALMALQRGQTLQHNLQDALQRILVDLNAQTAITELHAQHQHLKTELQTAQGYHAQWLTLDAKIQQHAVSAEALQQSQIHIESIQTQLSQEPVLRKTIQDLTAQIQALENPLVRQQLIHDQLAKRPNVIAARDELQRSLHDDERQLSALEQTLATFSRLGEQLQTQQQIREQTRTGYQLYLQHQERAQHVETLQQRYHDQATALADYQTDWDTLKQHCDRLNASYDLAHFQTLQSQFQVTQTQLIRAQARLPEMQHRLNDLEVQITQLTDIKRLCEAAETELKFQEKIRKFVVFARKSFKEAGPRITERYLVNISNEADRLFRELINRPNVALEWTRDYEIMVREDAFTRRFINLSGGEQMCAALAVRLALLRVLADLDIAFFDEPTTNMDRLRRQHLASAIANIRSFRQLFVISHDDTFEQVTDHVIVVERTV